MLCDIVSKGGNFLLNVGSTKEGLFPQASIDRLREVGAWMDVNGESIDGTSANPFSQLGMQAVIYRLIEKIQAAKNILLVEDAP